MTDTGNNNIEVRENRPTLLKVLCILSFVWMGINFFMSASGLVTGPDSKEEMTRAKVEMAKSIKELKGQGGDGMVSFVQKMGRFGNDLNNNHYLVVSTNLIIGLIGIFGVYLMFVGMKLGFHLYIIYSLMSVSVIYLYVSLENIPLFLPLAGLAFSGLFVFLYSRTLNWMR